MRYYIADCHFFHRSLLTKMDCRGFGSVDEMNETMINNWNSKVRSNDEVIILGDFSLGTAIQTAEVLDRLNGRLFLIRGNHDRFEKEKEYDCSQFGWIKDYEELNDNKRKVILCHYPIPFYNLQYRIDEDEKPKTYMLYGHVHNTHDEKLLQEFIDKIKSTVIVGPDGNEHLIPCQMINCFCGFSNYTPLTLDEWIENDRIRRSKISD